MSEYNSNIQRFDISDEESNSSVINDQSTELVQDNSTNNVNITINKKAGGVQELFIVIIFILILIYI